jgi:hypothetical protein
VDTAVFNQNRAIFHDGLWGNDGCLFNTEHLMNTLRL